jgi:hypothetical protein
MTLTPRIAARRLAATTTMLEKILRDLPPAIAAIHVHIETGGRDTDKPRVEDAGIRGIGGHSDPTGEQAIARAAAHERYLEDIEHRLTSLALTLGLLTDDCNRWTTVVAPSVRCSGGRVVDAWSRPDCTNWAAESSPGVPRGDGLCDACRSRKSRFERANEAA